MQEGPLLLSGAKSGVLVRPKLAPLHIAGGVFGIAFVLVGVFDIVSRTLSLGFAGTPPPQEEKKEQPTLPISPFIPARLSIPTLHIDARIEPVGVTAQGAMGVPSLFSTVAWYRGSVRPGAPGTTVLAGHLNNAAGTTGVFEDLHQLSLGDELVVVGEEGEEARFVVREMTVYPEEKAPRERIFTEGGASRLVLVTCNGAWDHDVRTYDKRLVIFADHM